MHEKNNGFSIELDETHLNEIEDVYNSNIEVFVTLQDGFSLTIVVGTPKNLQYLMEKDKVNFYGPGLPWIIVQKLTKGIIQEAIKAYIDDKADGYWLKLYHFAPDIDIAVFNQLQAQEIEESTEFELLCGLDDLKNEIDKLQKLDNAEKSKLVAGLEKLSQLLDPQEEETNLDD
jgi:hypothetical protein